MACIFSYLNPLVVAVVAIIIGVYYYYKRWNHVRHLIRNIPGPPSDPLFGNVDHFNDTFSFSEVNHIIHRTFDKYGSMFRLWLAHEIWICICDSKLAKEVIAHWKSYAAVPSFNFFGYVKEKDFVSESCLGWKKKYWAVQVKPQLEQKNLSEANVAVVSSLRSEAAKRPLGAEVIKSSVHEAMRQIYYDTAWHLKVGELSVEKIHKPIRDRIDISLLKGFQALQKTIADNFLLAHGVDSGIVKETIMAVQRVINKLLRKIESDQRRMHQKLNSAYLGDPQLEKPLNSMTDLNISFDDKSNPQWKSAVCEHVSTHISQSAENTSVFLTNLLHDMAVHPEIIAKIREEVEAVRSANGGKWPTLADEKKLKYTEMAIKEGLRHYAPPGLFYRAGTEFKKGDKLIPKDILVYICTSHIHMNLDYYKQPILFYPEHFSEEAEAARSGAYYPLALDPEGCEDKRFILKILKLMIAHLVMNFNFESTTKSDQINHDYFLMKENLKTMSLTCKLLAD